MLGVTIMNKCWEKIYMIHPYIQLMRLDKIYGTLLLLWPTLWALLLAGGGSIDFKVGVIFVLGAFIMRSCGCVLNDICDQDIDKKVARTKNRPLARGAINKISSWVVFFILSILALTLWLFLNTAARYLAIVGFLLACLYPLSKRVMACPQFFLGISFSWGIPMAYAVKGILLDWRGFLLYFAVIAWTAGYDTIYALQDIEDDSKLNIGSSAIFSGRYVKEFVSMLYTFFWISLGIVGYLYALNLAFWIVWLIVFYALFKQIKDMASSESDKFFRAFSSNQWIGFGVFLGIFIGMY